MRVLKRCRSFILTALLVALLSQIPIQNTEAAGLITPVKGWLRARIEYVYDSGITRLDDQRITFSANWGTRQEDGWYYYGYPVKSGDSITFIEGVTFPTSWTEDIQNRNLSIIITVEVAETVNEGGWDGNTQACYSCSFPLFTMTGTGQEITAFQNGRLKVDISEYQVDEDGVWAEYENDQRITPGQFVSKVVIFTLQRTFIRQTGDDMRIFLYGGIFIAAAAGTAYILRRGKKTAAKGGKNTCERNG